MNNFKVMMNGIIKENPTFVLLLGMCPTLGTTSSAINGMGMGLATMFVLICSNVVISLIKNLIPDMVRIPSFIVVIASFVTLLQMVMQAYVPGLYHTRPFHPVDRSELYRAGACRSFCRKEQCAGIHVRRYRYGAGLYHCPDFAGCCPRISGNRQDLRPDYSAGRIRNVGVRTGSGCFHRPGISHRID